MALIYVATSDGLFEVDSFDGGAKRDQSLGRRDMRGLAIDGAEMWAVVDGRTLAWRDRAGTWADLAASPSLDATCVLASSHGVLMGTEEAHLLHLHGGELAPVEAFDEVDGRDSWYTPWRGPPAVRTMAQDGSGRLHANVHVGGIPRSTDGGRTWEPTVDIDDDVHQVIGHPSNGDVVLAAAAVGLIVSRDGGGSWQVASDGLPSTYARAVAVAGDTILLTASEGPSGRHAALFGAPFEAKAADQVRFEKCSSGLPEWFDGNIDTGCLAASGSVAAFGTNDGEVFVSEDAGTTWRSVANGLPEVRGVTIGP